MRIMLDTNIFISMIFFPSEKMQLLKTKLSKYHRIVICSYVIDELSEVIRRKFSHKQKLLDEFFIELPYEMIYTPTVINTDGLYEIRDVDDEKVLYSAIMADVDVLLTGDKDFSDIDIERPEILTPSEFLEKY